jgi:hypothetical protein
MDGSLMFVLICKNAHLFIHEANRTDISEGFVYLKCYSRMEKPKIDRKGIVNPNDALP